MGRSGKGKKSGVPVIGEKEYAQYVAFLRREGNGCDKGALDSTSKNASAEYEPKENRLV